MLLHLRSCLPPRRTPLPGTRRDSVALLPIRLPPGARCARHRAPPRCRETRRTLTLGLFHEDKMRRYPMLWLFLGSIALFMIYAVTTLVLHPV